MWPPHPNPLPRQTHHPKATSFAGEREPDTAVGRMTQARVTPNKDGGFAPNYTPLATVDVASGLIVACDVIAMTNEEHHLVSQVEAVQANFGVEQPPKEVLADTMSLTGANLHALREVLKLVFSRKCGTLINTNQH